MSFLRSRARPRHAIARIARARRVGAADAHDLLRLLAEAQLGGGKEPIDDVVVPTYTIIDELAATGGTDDEERRRFALIEAGREFDIDLAAVVERPHRTPRRRVAANLVAEAKILQGEAAIDGRRRLGLLVLALERDQRVLGIAPGHGGDIGLGRALKLETVAAAAGGEYEVCVEAGGDRLDKDIDLLCLSRAAGGVAHHPAHRVAGGDRRQRLAG